MKIEEILKKVLEIPDLVLKKHEHSNKSIIDKITQTFLDNWNSAYNHISDNIRHITSTERSNWNDANSKKHTHENKTILDKINQSSLDNWSDKYTKNEIDNKISQVITDLDWKESVNTFSDIAKTYPKADDGWTVNVKDNNITYRFDGSKWIDISSNSIPLATSSLDGRMSKNDKAKLDGIAVNANNYTHPSSHSASMITEDSTHRFMTDTERNNLNDCNNKKHTHDNKSIIDKITQALLDNWNSAFSHVSDTVKHITSNERNLWNTVSNKVDKASGKQLSTNDYTTDEKNKLSGVATNANNYIHPVNHSADMIVDNANKRFTTDTEKSKWNTVDNKLDRSGGTITGNINISNDTEFGWNRNTDYAKIRFKNSGDNDTDSYMEFKTGDNGDEYFKFNQQNGGTTTELMSIKSDHLRFRGNVVYHTGNKPKLSELANDAGFITSKDVDTSQNHVHSNKSTLDKITQALIDSWNTISNKSDKLYVDGELAKKANNHSHPYRLDTWVPSWNDISSKPSAFTPINHNHSVITGGAANKIQLDQPNDYAGLDKKNNVNIDSWFGFSIANKCNNQPIPVDGVAFSVNARNGEVFAKGAIKSNGQNVVLNNDSRLSNPRLANGGNADTIGGKHANDFAASVHNHDDRYYTESEMNTKLAEKSNSNHTHNYAGSSSVGGSANTAIKLATAININGVAFDGSSNITVADSTKLPIAGGTVTGRTLFNQGISVKNINGGAGTSGYMYLAQIKITGNYQNQPITFNIHQRERFGTIIIKFNSQNTSDPTLAYINKIGSSEFNAYICKSGISTWDLYLQKSEGYDSIDIIGFSKGDYMSSTLITWQSSTVTSLPSGYTIASVGYLDIAATKANQDGNGNNITSTYVKKGMTWNELEGV